MVKASKTKSVGWIIQRPGGRGYEFFWTLKEALTMYEGFNVPRRVEVEPFAKSYERHRRAEGRRV